MQGTGNLRVRRRRTGRRKWKEEKEEDEEEEEEEEEKEHLEVIIETVHFTSLSLRSSLLLFSFARLTSPSTGSSGLQPPSSADPTR